MSKLDELITEFCPEGVEYRELSEVLTIRNGKDYRGFPEGDIPVYGSGGIMTYIDTSLYEKPSVLIPRKGSLDKLYYVDVPFWTVDTIFYTEINTSIIEPKFVFYHLQSQHLEKLNTAGGVPSLTQTILKKVRIPLPPLPVQQEIVRILDNFTELTAELTAELIAELTARRKQYEYYRDLLLTFGDEVPMVTLREITTITRGIRVVKSQLSEIGTYPVFQNSMTPLGYYEKSNYPKDTVFIISAGAAGEVGYSSVDFWAADDCLCITCTDCLQSKFLYYALLCQKDYLLSRVRRASVPRLARTVIEELKIPLPTLSEQQRIVVILDRFGALCNDLTSGLSAEIEARQKQYEYYRDKLLSFKELTA